MIACDPVASELVLHVAVPLANAVEEHNGLLPALNETVPVGVPVPGAFTDTEAVKVTACPTVEGFAELFTLVLVVACPTVCITCPLLAPKPEAPL